MASVGMQVLFYVTPVIFPAESAAPAPDLVVRRRAESDVPPARGRAAAAALERAGRRVRATSPPRIVPGRAGRSPQPSCIAHEPTAHRLRALIPVTDTWPGFNSITSISNSGSAPSGTRRCNPLSSAGLRRPPGRDAHGQGAAGPDAVDSLRRARRPDRPQRRRQEHAAQGDGRDLPAAARPRRHSRATSARCSSSSPVSRWKRPGGRTSGRARCCSACRREEIDREDREHRRVLQPRRVPRHSGAALLVGHVRAAGVRDVDRGRSADSAARRGDGGRRRRVHRKRARSG